MSGNKLNYKGFYADVEYLADEEIFYGKILNINDLVTFSATNAKDIKIEFFKAVDDYLETCQKLGREPNRKYSGSFNVRISPEIHKQIVDIAMRENISLNEFVARSIKQNLGG